ncbi:MAG: hypothetical protein QUV20_10545 [Oceanibaculum nanhaiense]|uniref:hypothetical protein n=1 Tax=Oceanibaculum nanhaiense TaxID=1909734 RepID=UPI0025A330E0|nr:hypothetical protein [Oceanibaculum nanhaiense]MDM7946755.1 hypothetical protein [Oceanibaculum nanhaiense]
MEKATQFQFQHRLFKIEGGYFRRDPQSGEAVYNLPSDELRVVLPINALRTEFRIEGDHPDAPLIDLVGQALKHVREVHPGDSIPNEVIDGSASWSIEPRHYKRARMRIDVQLASWISGDEQVLVDEDLLEQLADDPKTKEKLDKAIARLGEEIGGGGDVALSPSDRVSQRIEALVRELSYIEALREHFLALNNISEKLEKLVKLFKNSRVVKDEIARVKVLFSTPDKDIKNLLTDMDDHTSEVRSLVLNYENSVNYIREKRDVLRSYSLEWDDIFDLWRETPITADENAVRLIRSTYQFLSQRYAPSVKWTATGMR